jgi:hypothetical protein
MVWSNLTDLSGCVRLPRQGPASRSSRSARRIRESQRLLSRFRPQARAPERRSANHGDHAAPPPRNGLEVQVELSRQNPDVLLDNQECARQRERLGIRSVLAEACPFGDTAR